MTVLSIGQLAGVWEGNGGASAHVVTAVAVALAESGGDTRAVSPTADYGLWQINRMNFAALGLTPATALEQGPNARAAIRLSGNGTNWGDWCTCYADPARDCGRYRLAGPEAGSAAAGELARVIAVLGPQGGGVPPAPPGPVTGPGVSQAHQRWDMLAYVMGQWTADRYERISLAGRHVSRIG